MTARNSIKNILISLSEARVKIARMTLTIKLDGNWSSFQLASNTPPLSVTGSVIAPSARMLTYQSYSTSSAVHACGIISRVSQRSVRHYPNVCQHFCSMAERRDLLAHRASDVCSIMVGSSSQAKYLLRNSAMDDSIGGS